MGDEDENDVEDTGGYEKSRILLALFGWENHRSGLVPAVSWMVN